MQRGLEKNLSTMCYAFLKNARKITEDHSKYRGTQTGSIDNRGQILEWGETL